MEIAVFEAAGVSLAQKFQVQGDVLHQPFFVSEDYDRSLVCTYKNVGRTFVRFVTIHACAGQRDRQIGRQRDGVAIIKTALHIMQRGKIDPDSESYSQIIIIDCPFLWKVAVISAVVDFRHQIPPEFTARSAILPLRPTYGGTHRLYTYADSLNAVNGSNGDKGKYRNGGISHILSLIHI